MGCRGGVGWRSCRDGLVVSANQLIAIIMTSKFAISTPFHIGEALGWGVAEFGGT